MHALESTANERSYEDYFLLISRHATAGWFPVSILDQTEMFVLVLDQVPIADLADCRNQKAYLVRLSKVVGCAFREDVFLIAIVICAHVSARLNANRSNGMGFMLA